MILKKKKDRKVNLDFLVTVPLAIVLPKKFLALLAFIHQMKVGGHYGTVIILFSFLS